MEMRSNSLIQSRVLALAICLMGFSLIGCGVKGPPVPQQQPRVPTVMNLTYELSDGSAVFAWSLEESFSGKEAKEASFGLYQYRNSVQSELCEGCPLVFEKVVTIPLVDQESNRYVAEIPLESGYRYVFKVRLETENTKGPDSNTVQFVFSLDSSSGDSTTP